MDDGIIYVCKSTNNQNIRRGELKILNKYEDKLYFEFGENPKNIKKRFYRDVKTLNEDYENVLRLKEEEENPKKIEEENNTEENNTEKNVDNISEIVETIEKGNQGRSNKKKYPRKNSKLF